MKKIRTIIVDVAKFPFIPWVKKLQERRDLAVKHQQLVVVLVLIPQKTKGISRNSLTLHEWNLHHFSAIFVLS